MSRAVIGVALIGEGLDMHIPKGYIYFAMAFSLAVEIINSREGRITLTERAPWLVSLSFGLVHGLGFAGGPFIVHADWAEYAKPFIAALSVMMEVVLMAG